MLIKSVLDDFAEKIMCSDMELLHEKRMKIPGLSVLYLFFKTTKLLSYRYGYIKMRVVSVIDMI